MEVGKEMVAKVGKPLFTLRGNKISRNLGFV